MKQQMNNNVWELLDFIEISIKGLKFGSTLQSKNSDSEKEVITNHIKREICDYMKQNNPLKEVCTFFSNEITYDIKVMLDYHGDNLDTRMRYEIEGEVGYIDIKNSEDAEFFECYINMIQQHQIKKYGYDQFPYIYSSSHPQIIDLFLDRNIYQKLIKNAIGQLKEEKNSMELEEFENKLNQYYNSCKNFRVEPYHSHIIKSWNKELKYNIDNIKSKCKKLSAVGKDLKLFLYLINSIAQQANIDLSKGTAFSNFIAGVFNQNEETIDDYLKRMNKDDLSSLWNNNDLQMLRLLDIDTLVCKLSMDTLDQQIMRKKIGKALPVLSEQAIKGLQDNEKIKQYRILKELSIKKITNTKK